METTNVDIAIAVNGVGQALIKSSHGLAGSEDGRDRRRNGRVLHEQSVDVNVDRNCLVGCLGSLRKLCGKLLWRRCRTEWRTINLGNVSSMIAQRDRAIVWSTRSRLIGRIRSTTILKTRNVLAQMISSVSVVTTSSWSVRHHGGVARHVTRVASLRKVGHGGGVGIIRGVGQLSRSQRLGRIHAGSTEELAISGNVKLRVGGELVRHGRSGSQVGSRETGELVEHDVHGIALSSRSRNLSKGALALGLMVSAVWRLSVHVGSGTIGLSMCGSLLVRHGNL